MNHKKNKSNDKEVIKMINAEYRKFQDALLLLQKEQRDLFAEYRRRLDDLKEKKIK